MKVIFTPPICVTNGTVGTRFVPTGSTFPRSERLDPTIMSVGKEVILVIALLPEVNIPVNVPPTGLPTEYWYCPAIQLNTVSCWVKTYASSFDRESSRSLSVVNPT